MPTRTHSTDRPHPPRRRQGPHYDKVYYTFIVSHTHTHTLSLHIHIQAGITYFHAYIYIYM